MGKAFILPIDGKGAGWISLGAAETTEPVFAPSEEAEGVELSSSNLGFSFTTTGSLTLEAFAKLRKMAEPLCAIKVGDKELPGAYRVTKKENPDGSVSVNAKPADESTEWALRAWIEEEKKKNADRIRVPRL